MRYISIGLVFLLMGVTSPLSVAFAEEHEKVIIINERVGEVIDAKERDRYALFPQIEGFKSAVFLQLSDGSYVVEVIYEEDGEEKTTRIPQIEIAIKSLNSYIEKVSKEAIQPVFLADEEKTEEEKSESYSKGEKLIVISEKVGEVIDAKERERFGLWPEIEGFKSATFLHLSDGRYSVEVTYEENGEERKDWIQLNEAQFLSLKNQVDPEIAKSRQVAAQQAKKDASRDVNEVKWVLIGCSSLLIGVNHANSAEIPPPNPERLLGKSMEYIEVYDRAYYKQVRALRRKYSIIGCISGGIIYTYAVVQGVSYIEGSSSEANSCCSGGAGEDTKMVWEIFSGCCISGK